MPLGDCWRHAAVRGEGPTDGWMPFHKLSQWLTYSLLEPFEWAGVQVQGLDALTGLPEYRNGGLLLDTGVLRLRDPAWAARSLAAGRRAGRRVARADRGAARRTGPAGAHSDWTWTPNRCRWPACSRAATWAAGRALAQRQRDGLPPLQSPATARFLSSHGTTSTSIDHPLVQHKLTLMRRKEASTNSFRRC